VAEIKAVILSICPNALIVDVSHQIEKFNIKMGAFVLASAFPYFPKGTIHVAVIDPGVGTERQPLLVETGKGYFIGPNNGVLALAVRNAGGVLHFRRITDKHFMLSKASNTFHGRDVFAPVAAHLARGRSAKEFGPEVGKIVVPEFAIVSERKDMLIGEVVHIDDFGNIVTNFREKEVELAGVKSSIMVKLRNAKLKLKFCKTYADVERREPLTIIGGHGFFEISVNQGNAAEIFRIKVGEKVTLYRH
jgi:S-adenosylmethionine hydrolase